MARAHSTHGECAAAAAGLARDEAAAAAAAHAAAAAAQAAVAAQKPPRNQSHRYFSTLVESDDAEMEDGEISSDEEGEIPGSEETPTAVQQLGSGGALGLSAPVGSVVAQLQARVAEHKHDVGAWLCLVLEAVAPLENRRAPQGAGAWASLPVFFQFQKLNKTGQQTGFAL